MITNAPIGNLGNKTPEDYFSSLLSTLITFVLTVGAIVFFFWFIWGAITWITSGGDKGRAEAARSRITMAVFGIVLLIATWAVISLIEGIFNINITTISFSDLYIK
jgi:hypothetical protein